MDWTLNKYQTQRFFVKEEIEPKNIPVKYTLMCRCNGTHSYVSPEQLFDHKPITKICGKCRIKQMVVKNFIYK